MEPIMTIHVAIDGPGCSHMEMPDGMVTMIPFTGSVEGRLFNGRILPGGVDVQVTNPAGVKHMFARYMLEGTDYTGAECRIYVENNAYFERNSNPSPFEAWPVFRTDSAALRPRLQGMHFRAEGHGTDIGVDILIFDTEESGK